MKGTPRQTFPHKRPAAFTLVELLVVIAVIGVLAALLLSAMAGAGAAAKSAACQSNVRQLGLSLSVYVIDHEFYPGFMGVRGEPPGDWVDRLEPYTQSKWSNALYRCPGYRGDTAELKDSAGGVVVRSGSYGYNGFGTAGSPASGWGWNPFELQLGLGTGGVYPSQSPRKLQVQTSQIKAPSEMMALGDATLLFLSTPTGPKGQGVGLLDYADGWSWWGSSIYPRYGIRARHRDARCNIAFCDGHLESIRGEDLFARKKNTHRARWNNDNEPHYETGPRFKLPGDP